MIRVKFKCPTCGRDISVKATNRDALAGQTFHCPHCHNDKPFDSILGQTAQMRTYFAPASGHNTDSQTRVSQNAPVTLVLESGRRIPIFPGEHILGRDSSDSGAEIHVAPDIYMSRSHARLSVAVGPDNSVQCSLTPLESANSIVVNSRALRTGEQTTLANGDRVLLGITGFTVEII